MHTHAFGSTFGAALELARGLKHGPLPARADPVPSPEEAIGIIVQERRTCGFNWITGEVAQAVIQGVSGGPAGEGLF